MASMSFKLSLLLLFLLWGLKPTFLESCSRVWKWTQSFVFFFFVDSYIFRQKGTYKFPTTREDCTFVVFGLSYYKREKCMTLFVSGLSVMSH